MYVSAKESIVFSDISLMAILHVGGLKYSINLFTLFRCTLSELVHVDIHSCNVRYVTSIYLLFTVHCISLLLIHVI